MRQKMWVWVGIGMLVATLIGGVALQGGDRGLLGPSLLLADGGDNPGGGNNCPGKGCR
jgi:hypothetical protein